MSTPYPSPTRRTRRGYPQDLRERFEQMFDVMMPVIRTIKDIKVEAGQLNLRYERRVRFVSGKPFYSRYSCRATPNC